jgi:hypothetical protein
MKSLVTGVENVTPYQKSLKGSAKNKNVPRHRHADCPVPRILGNWRISPGVEAAR